MLEVHCITVFFFFSWKEPIGLLWCTTDLLLHVHEGLKVGDEFGLELVGSLPLLEGNTAVHSSSHRGSITLGQR